MYKYHVLLVIGEKSSEHILLSYVTYDFMELGKAGTC